MSEVRLSDRDLDVLAYCADAAESDLCMTDMSDDRDEEQEALAYIARVRDIIAEAKAEPGIVAPVEVADASAKAVTLALIETHDKIRAQIADHTTNMKVREPQTFSFEAGRIEGLFDAAGLLRTMMENPSDE